MKISFGEIALPKSGAVVVGVLEGGTLSPSAADLDKRTGGAVKRAIAASRFTGKKDELLAVLAPANLGLSRIVLAGLGKAGDIDTARVQSIGGNLTAHLNGAGEKEATVLVDEIEGALSPAEAAANLAFGARLRSYRFDRHRTKEKP